MAKTDKTGHLKLSDNQHLAIQALIMGATDEQAAKVASVERQTVNHWKNNDSTFIHELNDKRVQLWNNAQDQALSLISSAIVTISSAINNGDIKASIWLLDKVDLNNMIECGRRKIFEQQRRVIDGEESKKLSEITKNANLIADRLFARKYGMSYVEYINPEIKVHSVLDMQFLKDEYDELKDQAREHLSQKNS